MLAEDSDWGELDEEKKWANEMGIKFTRVTTDDVEELKSFMHEHFYCDEPVCRSIEVIKGDAWYDKWMFNIFQDVVLLDPILKAHTPGGNSIIARKIIGNSIVGCYIGVTYKNTFNLEALPVTLIGKLPSFLQLPQKLIDVVNVQKLCADLCYGKSQAFHELEDSGDFIHFLASLTVSKEAREKGLGTELVRRGNYMVKKSGCRYTYVLATSKYLQNIFQKLSNAKLLHDAEYDDYKYDEKGRPFLLDNRDHDVIQVVAIDHGK